jgi:hypothetical protein
MMEGVNSWKENEIIYNLQIFQFLTSCLGDVSETDFITLEHTRSEF